MCCGVSQVTDTAEHLSPRLTLHNTCPLTLQNTYHTLKDLRFVLIDGTVLDTADPASCASFLKVVVVCVWGGGGGVGGQLCVA